MARNAGATREEVEAILGKYKQSGLTRQEYCKQEGMTVYMLDYYQRRLYKLRERDALAAKKRGVAPATAASPRIARVEIEKKASPTAPAATATTTGIAMTLSNGRRIEVHNWGFRDQDLARLIQVAERA